MILGRAGRNLAVLAVLCVLMVFLFPAVQGPYSAVHGPATALQAARAAVRLRVAIAQAALGSVRNYPIAPVVLFSWMFPSKAELWSTRKSGYNTILLC
jgi:hypothetical protein